MHLGLAWLYWLARASLASAFMADYSVELEQMWALPLRPALLTFLVIDPTYAPACTEFMNSDQCIN